MQTGLVALSPHDQVNADQGADCLLSNNVLAISEFAHEPWNVLPQACTAQVGLVLILLVNSWRHLTLIVTGYIQMLRHTDHQIDNRQRHKHNFEVLVAEKGDEKLKQALGLVKDPPRVCLYAVLDRDMNLIDRRRAHLPMVRGV